jgi:hypothetical protein
LLNLYFIDSYIASNSGIVIELAFEEVEIIFKVREVIRATTNAASAGIQKAMGMAAVLS